MTLSPFARRPPALGPANHPRPATAPPDGPTRDPAAIAAEELAKVLPRCDGIAIGDRVARVAFTHDKVIWCVPVNETLSYTWWARGRFFCLPAWRVREVPRLAWDSWCRGADARPHS